MVVTKLTLIGSLIAKLTIANLDHFATAGRIEQITWSMRNNIFIMMLRKKYIDIYICVRMGQGFGGFLDLREKVFFLNAMPGGCLTPRRSSFIYICLEKYIYCYNRLQPNTKRNYDCYFQLG